MVTQAAPASLVISPISNNCFGCHDNATAKLHMETNGGAIYQPRASTPIGTEQCMLCHGPGRVAAIKAMHSK